MQKIKDKLLKGTLIGLLSLLGYQIGLTGVNEYLRRNSTKFENKKQLEEVLKSEIEKLEIKNKLIKVQYQKEDQADSRKTGTNEYVISIGPSFNNDNVLKHELYHIADGHCDYTYKLNEIYKKHPLLAPAVGFYNTSKYLFYNEPQAIIYTATGWEI